ncbi:cysteine synthase family protein [Streptosporangium sp. NPDC002544]|uniref:PLP-dependent cysteine synthase family protein n=1 Tax=Streptosporangium sp. NPDC002544 TaxID=3154538 RepID=UPI003319B67B
MVGPTIEVMSEGIERTGGIRGLSGDVLQTIGNTPLVRLRRVVPSGCAEIFVKVEGQNPTGSMKDRMAQAMIARAEGDGRLRPGDTVVEYTGGSTGASLALVCAAKGYQLRIVSSDAFSADKLLQMAAFGAELTVIPSEGGSITKALILSMIEKAGEFGRRPGTYWTDQLNNADSIVGYHPMGEEIWEQSGGRIDAFVQSIGTAASLRGAAAPLRRRRPGLRVIAVEPAESAVLSGGRPGAHRIEGIGIGYLPPMWDPTLVDEIVPISTADAEEMAGRLAREEGLFAGTSSGANVLAAIQAGQRLGPTARVVTLLVDSGLKYLSTDMYRRQYRVRPGSPS